VGQARKKAMRFTDETLVWFDQIRADERERCAMIAERRAIAWERDDISLWTKATEARAIAAAIREEGKK